MVFLKPGASFSPKLAGAPVIGPRSLGYALPGRLERERGEAAAAGHVLMPSWYGTAGSSPVKDSDDAWNIVGWLKPLYGGQSRCDGVVWLLYFIETWQGGPFKAD